MVVLAAWQTNQPESVQQKDPRRQRESEGIYKQHEPPVQLLLPLDYLEHLEPGNYYCWYLLILSKD